MRTATGRTVFAGMIPALMTPLKAGRRDFDQLVVVATSLIAKGASGVVYAGSMGEWPLLSDHDRMEGVRRLCAANIPVIVGTGHPNPASAVAIAAHAKEVGAAGLMIIPRQSSRVAVPSAQRTHFRSVLKAGAPLPAVVYNSPYYGFSMQPDLFAELRRDFPNLVGFKEFGGTADLTRDAQGITAGKSELALLVGVDTAVCHGYLFCGAIGAITGIGNVLPEQVSFLLRLCEAARTDTPTCCEARRLALELEGAMLQLAKFDEGPDLVLYYKRLMTLSGVDGYSEPLLAGDVLGESQDAFVCEQYNLFMTWWKHWPGKSFFG